MIALIEDIYLSLIRYEMGEYPMLTHIEPKQTAADDGDGSDGVDISNHLHNSSPAPNEILNSGWTRGCRREQQAVEEGEEQKMFVAQAIGLLDAGQSIACTPPLPTAPGGRLMIGHLLTTHLPLSANFAGECPTVRRLPIEPWHETRRVGDARCCTALSFCGDPVYDLQASRC